MARDESDENRTGPIERRLRALEARERVLRAVVGTMRDVVLEIDTEGRFLNIWGDDESTLYRPAAEQLGRNIEEFVGPQVTRDFGERVARIRAHGKPEEFDFTLDAHHFRVKMCCIGGASEEAPETVWVGVTEITERKHAELALRESEERLRQMAETIKEAFFVIDLEPWRLVYATPTWSEIWGRPLAAVGEEQVWDESIHAADRHAFAAALQAVRQGEESAATGRVLRPDGAVRWVRARFYPVRAEDGTVQRIVGAAEDITDVRRVEQQMVQAQKLEAVGRLAAGVAHDFNNLLTVIISECTLALPELPPESPAIESLEEIRKAGERAAVLTRQLLTFSRPQTGEPQIVLMSDVITGMESMLGRLIRADVRLETRLRDRVARVRADRSQLEQVLMNLVVNARDAMPAGGRIVIETSRLHLEEPRDALTGSLPPGEYVVITVSDSGVGMDAETRARIFEPFFTTKAAAKGTGLGLSMTYGIVQHAGGQIDVYSEPGVGTTFRVYLPRMSRAASGADMAEMKLYAGGSETILLVEDDPAVRRVVVGTLERVGYTVLEAGDAASALDVAREAVQIDLIIADIVMPDARGPDLVADILEHRPELRVLFTSGYAEWEVADFGATGHQVDFVPKPFTPRQLTAKVRELLDS